MRTKRMLIDIGNKNQKKYYHFITKTKFLNK